MRNNSIKLLEFGEFEEFGPVVQKEMPLKEFLILSSDSSFFQRRKTICAIMVEGIKRNISVNLF